MLGYNYLFLLLSVFFFFFESIRLSPESSLRLRYEAACCLVPTEVQNKSLYTFLFGNSGLGSICVSM